MTTLGLHPNQPQSRRALVAIARPFDGPLTYSIPADFPALEPGTAVQVPLGRQDLTGFIIEELGPDHPAFGSVDAAKLKPIRSLLTETSAFSPEVWRLCRWAMDYYQGPPGELLQAAVPDVVLGKKATKQRKQKARPNSEIRNSTPSTLTPSQQVAVDLIESGPPGSSTLLQGVTGSGKTEVYLELARRTIAAGKSVLVLVPEIALTPQLRDRFESGLGRPIALWHSAVADGQRFEEWNAVRRGELRVVVGARSAIFAPLQKLGLIIVDEEHETSYKQEDRFRYHARDLAVVRAKFEQGRCVLGSATPSLESLENVNQKRYGYAHLQERFGSAGLPKIEIISLAETPRAEGVRAPLAEASIAALRETLARGEQAMIFLNRRGFAAFLLCEDCGAVEECPECSVSLAYHQRPPRLRCHHCGYDAGVPLRCNSCQSDHLVPVGAGTESLESELPLLVPEAKVLRLDRDQVTSNRRLNQILDDFRELKANVLLGTQMIAKGHDFPKVTLVIVILADGLFRWPDFRASERAVQLLLQVSGRAGRSVDPGKVLIQTFDPDHPVIGVLAGRESLQDFQTRELEMRKELGFPPFGRMTLLRYEAKDARLLDEICDQHAGELRRRFPDGLEIFGPLVPAIERLQGKFRKDIILRSPSGPLLLKVASAARGLPHGRDLSLTIDMDPARVG